MTGTAPELVFVPLGGCGEIGMNLNLYGWGPPEDRRWLMVDLGITFGDDSTPGIEVIMPDPQFIEEQSDRLDGILLTHGHEDHLGAVPYLWSRFGCPVYATPFTLALLRRKLEARTRTSRCWRLMAPVVLWTQLLRLTRRCSSIGLLPGGRSGSAKKSWAELSPPLRSSLPRPKALSGSR